MKQVDNRIKKRRDERIRSLQEKYHTPWPPAPRHDFGSPVGRTLDRPMSSGVKTRERTRRRQGRWLVQTLLACLLLVFTYVTFQADSPSAKYLQATVTEIMERDFNFRGLADWYEANVGGIPAIIPTFSENNAPPPDPSLQTGSWQLPITGDMTDHYTTSHPYVTFSGDANDLVQSSAAGLVHSVEKKEGWGQCIIVRHGSGAETWYGGLETIEVERKDWVEPGQVLGKLGETGGALQFGVRRDGTFINPLDVISVE